jgi:hypothetical protein
LGWLHYLDLSGRSVAPVAPSSGDFRHIVLVRDIDTIRSYRRAGLLSWRELTRSYRRPVYFFDFDLRDWRVTAATVVELVRLLLRPMLRRLFPKRSPEAGCQLLFQQTPKSELQPQCELQ